MVDSFKGNDQFRAQKTTLHQHMGCETAPDLLRARYRFNPEGEHFKVATLFALTTASRSSDIASLSTEHMNLGSERAIFEISKSKTWNKRVMKPIHIHKFTANSNYVHLLLLTPTCLQHIQLETKTRLYL